MRYPIPPFLLATLAMLCMLGCGKHEKDSEDQANSPARDPAPRDQDQESREEKLEAAMRERDEERLREEIDAYLAEAEQRADEDLLENPVFKRHFDDLLKHYELTDEQKSKFGELVNLLKAVNPDDYDNPERETRLGLTGDVARRLVETSRTGDVGGLVDEILGQVEEIAIGQIENPSEVRHRGGVVLHTDGSSNR